MGGSIDVPPGELHRRQQAAENTLMTSEGLHLESLAIAASRSNPSIVILTTGIDNSADVKTFFVLEPSD